MSSTRKIRLHTEIGWELMVDVDVPVFATLLAPILDLGSEASELLLTGSVAEAFEQEYSYVVDLIAMVELGQRDEVQALRWAESSYIILERVRSITRILDMPEGWEKYVGVLPGDPEYVRHLCAAARHLSKNRRLSPFDSVYGGSTQAKLVMRIGCRYTSDYSLVVDKPLLACVNNFYLTDYSLEGTLHGFDWKGVLEVMEARGVATDGLKVAYLTYHGEGSHSDSGNFNEVVSSMSVYEEDVGGSEWLEITLAHPVSLYYPIALTSFPESIDADTFGLEYLISPWSNEGRYVYDLQSTSHKPANDFSSIVSWVHHNLSLIARENARYSPECNSTQEIELEQVRLFIEYAYDYIMGHQGLSRVLQSILHETKKEGVDSERMKRLETIASMISDTMKTRSPGGPPENRFPSYSS